MTADQGCFVEATTIMSKVTDRVVIIIDVVVVRGRTCHVLACLSRIERSLREQQVVLAQML